MLPCRISLVAALALLSCSSVASAQSSVSLANKFAWGENVGWINFRDANSSTQGVRFNPNLAPYFSGFAWGENIGWINVGDGSPTNGTAYANVNGTDFGLNYDAATDRVTGFAWGENIGWINFTVPGIPLAQQPNYEPTTRRLRGYAWGENIGWMNLDSLVGTKFVSFDFRCSPADIADDQGTPLPPYGNGGIPPQVNNGVTEGDYNAFFANFFDAFPVCDIADDTGQPLPPFGLGGLPPFVNNGVTEADYNLFFSVFFDGCPV